MEKITAIVPVRSSVEPWRNLAVDLVSLSGIEVIFVSPSPCPDDFLEAENVRWIQNEDPIASALNQAAKLARYDWLWFLPAGCRLSVDAILNLRESLSQAPQALHYFNLQFQEDGPWLVKFNALALEAGAKWLGFPRFSQGYALHRNVFDRLGCFEESLDGLALEARKKAIELRSTGGTLFISARRYFEKGWIRATAQDLQTTVKTILPIFSLN